MLPSGSKWAVENAVFTDDGTIIAEAIRLGTCIAISDGSFKDGIGTASWVLEGSSSEGRIIGQCMSPGQVREQGSYRSELAGQYALATMVNLLCSFFDITSGQVVIACDGLSALTNSSAEQHEDSLPNWWKYEGLWKFWKMRTEHESRGQNNHC